MTFKREERYWVIKIKDLSDDQRAELGNYLVADRIPTRECVVVESDWLIYEETWENVQRLEEGKPTIGRERDQLRQTVTDLRQYRDDLIADRDALKQAIQAIVNAPDLPSAEDAMTHAESLL